jgi:ribosomal protein S6-L-glutamate ligase RimK-like protein
MSKAPIAVYYEHPRWFERVFAELDRRGIPYVKVDAAHHHYDLLSNGHHNYSLMFNRMSPSAWTRGNAHSIFYTLNYLSHLEESGTRVVNGSHAFRVETSKALQLSLLQSLGLPYPRSRVINHPSEAEVASSGLRFPIVIKPNIGGSGAGIVRFDTPAQIESAVANNKIALGLDGVGIVQEFIPAQGGHIVRVETLGYKYLYAIKVFTTGETFDLCPADICKTVDGTELNTSCVIEGPKSGLRVEAYRPPPDIIADVERIFTTAKIEVGGVEYVIDARDGRHYYYDVNALSNFVADGPTLLGFDPFVRLVDYLEQEAA